MRNATNQSAKEQKVLIVVTSHDQLGDTNEQTGLWLAEATHPYQVFEQAGFDVDIASIRGGRAPIDPKSLDDGDSVNRSFFADPQRCDKLENTLPVDKAKASDYSAVLFSGGHGTVWDFPDNPVLDKLAATIYDNGGVVAALCHGSAALLGLHDDAGGLLIKGKKVAGFSNAEERAVELDAVVPYLLEDKLRQAGATYVEGKPFETNVVVDRRIVSGQNPQSSTELGEQVVSLLKH